MPNLGGQFLKVAKLIYDPNLFIYITVGSYLGKNMVPILLLLGMDFYCRDEDLSEKLPSGASEEVQENTICVLKIFFKNSFGIRVSCSKLTLKARSKLAYLR
jgi:hypothetical protein